MASVTFLLALTLVVCTQALDNGLARTPPLGFMAWERFRCNTDCVTTPNTCVSEWLLMEMSDVMKAEGYVDAGYQYVSVDDCWLDHERSSAGELQPDPYRFPSGMKALADHIHANGMKFGIYGDIGNKTCAGYPGNYGHFEQDMNTYAKWGVDMLKLDGCNAEPTSYDSGYPMITKFLNQTGRPILFACSWPDYVRAQGIMPNYTAVAENCNMWRNFDDISDDWDSIKSIIDFYTKDDGNFSKVAGPGNFNDPDELLVGDYGLTINQQWTQMFFWSIFASPIFVSADLRTINEESKAILLNRYVLKVNQDPLGVQGWIVFTKATISGYYRPLDQGSGAILLYNIDTAMPNLVTFTLREVGLTQNPQYACYETKDNTFIDVFKIDTPIQFWVEGSGGSRLFHCIPSSSKTGYKAWRV